MPAPAPGNQPWRSRPMLLRRVAFGVAVALGAVAIWLIVTSTTQKLLEIGILLGLWGLWVAFAALGTRSRGTGAPAGQPSQELDIRKIGELEQAAVAAARRDFQAELQRMLREEVQAGVAAEVAKLRAEVAALRHEMVEKVGGQLRLEHIETTRLIGSDLEALQQELRQLRKFGGLDAGTTEVHIAEVIDEVQHTQQRATAPRSDGRGDVHDPEPEPEPEPEPGPEPPRRQDAFAGLPRLPRFTDVELLPIDNEARDPQPRAGRHASADEQTGGRRRRAEDGDNDVLARILARERR